MYLIFFGISVGKGGKGGGGGGGGCAKRSMVGKGNSLDRDSVQRQGRVSWRVWISQQAQ